MKQDKKRSSQRRQKTRSKRKGQTIKCWRKHRNDCVYSLAGSFVADAFDKPKHEIRESYYPSKRFVFFFPPSEDRLVASHLLGELATNESTRRIAECRREARDGSVEASTNDALHPRIYNTDTVASAIKCFYAVGST